LTVTVIAGEEETSPAPVADVGVAIDAAVDSKDALRQIEELREQWTAHQAELSRMKEMLAVLASSGAEKQSLTPTVSETQEIAQETVQEAIPEIVEEIVTALEIPELEPETALTDMDILQTEEQESEHQKEAEAQVRRPFLRGGRAERVYL
jgi:hypothetical protein